jgi:hypothetical protein
MTGQSLGRVSLSEAERNPVLALEMVSKVNFLDLFIGSMVD